MVVDATLMLELANQRWEAIRLRHLRVVAFLRPWRQDEATNNTSHSPISLALGRTYCASPSSVTQLKGLPPKPRIPVYPSFGMPVPTVVFDCLNALRLGVSRSYALPNGALPRSMKSSECRVVADNGGSMPTFAALPRM